MSTSIHEGISELQDRLRAERAIAERFPDAVLDKLPDGRNVWVSESARDHVTDFELVYGQSFNNWHSDRGRPHMYVNVYTYLTVEEMRVYARPIYGGDAALWIHDLKTKHQDVYKALVAVTK